MAIVQRYVDTASSGGDGTTQSHSGSTAAYASLSSWEANVTNAKTDTVIVDCAGSTADTTAVEVNLGSLALGAGGSTLVRGDRNAPDSDGFYSGNSVISTGHYRLSTSSINTLDLAGRSSFVDGIQVISSHASTGGHAIRAQYSSSAVAYTIENCRVLNTSTCDTGIGNSLTRNGGRTYRNNLVVGFVASGITMVMTTGFTTTHNFLHNTVYGSGGSSVGITWVGGTGAALVAIKGNAIANTGGNDLAITPASSVVTYADNALEDYDLGTTDEIDLGTTTDAWTSPGTSSTDDFTVKNTGSSLYAAVNPTLDANDITDFTRDGTNHDVGCFEFQAPADPLTKSLTRSAAVGRAASY